VADRLLSVGEVSERCGYAMSTLYQLRSRGEGPPSFRLGNRVKVKESDLQAWIAEAEAAEQARLAGLAVNREEKARGQFCMVNMKVRTSATGLLRSTGTPDVDQPEGATVLGRHRGSDLCQ
jgi:predicted DNA-binding transcriptional regulator AlpA